MTQFEIDQRYRRQVELVERLYKEQRSLDEAGAKWTDPERHLLFERWATACSHQVLLFPMTTSGKRFAAVCDRLDADNTEVEPEPEESNVVRVSF